MGTDLADTHTTGHTTDVATPQLLSTFAGKEMRKVAAGGGYDDDASTGFSLALSAGRTLFAFGSNARGQLGACALSVQCSAAAGFACVCVCVCVGRSLSGTVSAL